MKKVHANKKLICLFIQAKNIEQNGDLKTVERPWKKIKQE